MFLKSSTEGVWDLNGVVHWFWVIDWKGDKLLCFTLLLIKELPFVTRCLIIMQLWTKMELFNVQIGCVKKIKLNFVDVPTTHIPWPRHILTQFWEGTSKLKFNYYIEILKISFKSTICYGANALKGVLHPWPILWLFIHFSEKISTH